MNPQYTIKLKCFSTSVLNASTDIQITEVNLSVCDNLIVSLADGRDIEFTGCSCNIKKRHNGGVGTPNDGIADETIYGAKAYAFHLFSTVDKKVGELSLQQQEHKTAIESVRNTTNKHSSQIEDLQGAVKSIDEDYRGVNGQEGIRKIVIDTSEVVSQHRQIIDALEESVASKTAFNNEYERVLSDRAIAEQENINFLSQYHPFIDSEGYEILDSAGYAIMLRVSNSYDSYILCYEAYKRALEDIIKSEGIPINASSVDRERKSYYESLTKFKKELSNEILVRLNNN